MKKCIAVVNQKGGVGKTSTAYNLACCLSTTHEVLLIDLDPSANATFGLTKEKNFKFTSSDLFQRNFSGLMKSIIFPLDAAPAYNLGLIPSCINLAMVQRDISNRPFKEALLAKQLDKFFLLPSDKSSPFEFSTNGNPKPFIIIIDCPPTLTDLSVNAMYAANFILVPILYEEDSLNGLKDLYTTLDEIKEDQPYKVKILRNKYNETTKIMNRYISAKIDDLDRAGKLFKTIIRQCSDIPLAKTENLPVNLYAPKSRGAQDYLSLAQEIINEKM